MPPPTGHKPDLNESDSFFALISNNPKLGKIVTRLLMMSRFLTMFGLLFFFFGIVALIFYRNKTALWSMGFISLIHVIGGPLGLISAHHRNRNLLLIIALCNIVWLFFTCILIFVCIFVLGPGPEKDEFREEIILHVGLFFYIPMTAVSAYYCIQLLMYFYRMADKSPEDPIPKLDVPVKERSGNSSPAKGKAAASGAVTIANQTETGAAGKPSHSREMATGGSTGSSGFDIEHIEQQNGSNSTTSPDITNTVNSPPPLKPTDSTSSSSKDTPPTPPSSPITTGGQDIPVTNEGAPDTGNIKTTTNA